MSEIELERELDKRAINIVRMNIIREAALRVKREQMDSRREALNLDSCNYNEMENFNYDDD